MDAHRYDQGRKQSVWFSPFLLAVVLSPVVFQTSSYCTPLPPGDITLSELAVIVGEQEQIEFDASQRSYDVWLPLSADAVLVRAFPTDPNAQVSISLRTGFDRLDAMPWTVGGGEVVIPLEPGPHTLLVGVFPPPDAFGNGISGQYTVEIQVGSVFPCTEDGIRDAIALGGGIHTFDCDGPTTIVTEDEMVVENHVALDGKGMLTLDGGGTHRLFWIAEGATAQLRGLTVTNGFEIIGSGGALWNFGTLEVVDGVVSNSHAGVHGGGIYNIGGTVRLVRTTVAGNRANHHGGGICNFNDITDDSNGALTVIDSTFSDNEAGQLGGGIYAIGGTTTSVTNSAVVRNEGTGVNAAGLVTIASSLIAQNQGIGIRAAGSFTVVDIKNSTISGNVSGLAAGGVRVQYEATVLVENSTIADNSAAALESWVGTTTVFKNTLIEGSCRGYGTSSTGGNVASPGDVCVLDHPTDLVGVASEELNLGPLADNGGPTETHALLPGSVAIDAIPADMCEVDEDQRGEPRDSMCDVGAFEVQP
jgi:hypothetical protein